MTGDTRESAPLPAGGDVDEGDRALVAGVVARTPSALEALYDRYAGAVHAACLRVTRDPQDAEELLGDVFWDFWSHPGRYDASRAGIGTYLVVLARSRALDRARRHGRRSRIERAPDTRARIAEGAHASDGGESPAESALRGERSTVVTEALARIDDGQQAALEMSFFDGLSHAEIAERTGLPLGTVKGRIRQGLLHVRRYVADRYGEAT